MAIYITLIMLASVMNAIMDRVENIVAFNRSIFSHADKRFWCKEISWIKKYETLFKIKIPYLTWRKSGRK